MRGTKSPMATTALGFGYESQSQSFSVIMSAMDIEAAHDAITRGESALRAGDWEGARALFEAALADEESPVAHEGLGRALWWLRDTEGAIAHVELAYAGYRAAGWTSEARRRCSLARAGVRSGVRQRGGQCGVVRARRGPAAGAGDVPEQGWLWLTRAERARGPTEMARQAKEALETARRFGDERPRGSRTRSPRLRGGRGRRRRGGDGQGGRGPRGGDRRRRRQPRDDRRCDLRRDRGVRAGRGLAAHRAVGAGSPGVDHLPRPHGGAGLLLRVLRRDVHRLGQMGDGRRDARRGATGDGGRQPPGALRPPGGEAGRAPSDPGPARGGRAAARRVRGAARVDARARLSVPGAGRYGDGGGRAPPGSTRSATTTCWPRRSSPSCRRAARPGRHGRRRRPQPPGSSALRPARRCPGSRRWLASRGASVAAAGATRRPRRPRRSPSRRSPRSTFRSKLREPGSS